MFRKMPFFLFFTIAAVVLLSDFMPLKLQQFLYSLSLSIKSMIIFLLPIIIFSLLFKASVMLARNATKIIGLILVLVCASNFIATFISHYIGELVYSFDLSMLEPQKGVELQTLWNFNLPPLIANAKAMFAGIIIGLLAFKIHSYEANRFAFQLERLVTFILKIIVYLIPLFVAGFVVKLQFEGVVKVLLKDYIAVFAIVAVAQFSYIILSYLLLNNCKFKKFTENLRNMLPAAVSGFSTMSSAASMPLTLIGVEHSVTNKDVAKTVVPTTVNIHLIGDCFAIPILAYAILKSFGMAEPTLYQYLVFTFYFVVAKFSVAAAPGGGIMVMLPILEAHLGFNAAMMSLITALYILFDPVITCANVLGNGAFARLVDKLFNAQFKLADASCKEG